MDFCWKETSLLTSHGVSPLTIVTLTNSSRLKKYHHYPPLRCCFPFPPMSCFCSLAVHSTLYFVRNNLRDAPFGRWQRALHQHDNGQRLTYWSRSSSKGHRSLRHEAETKAAETERCALVRTEWWKGEVGESCAQFCCATANSPNLWRRAWKIYPRMKPKVIFFTFHCLDDRSICVRCQRLPAKMSCSLFNAKKKILCF